MDHLKQFNWSFFISFLICTNLAFFFVMKENSFKMFAFIHLFFCHSILETADDLQQKRQVMQRIKLRNDVAKEKYVFLSTQTQISIQWNGSKKICISFLVLLWKVFFPADWLCLEARALFSSFSPVCKFLYI